MGSARYPRTNLRFEVLEDVHGPLRWDVPRDTQLILITLVDCRYQVPSGIICDRFTVTTSDDALFDAVMAAYLGGEFRATVFAPGVPQLMEGTLELLQLQWCRIRKDLQAASFRMDDVMPLSRGADISGLSSSVTDAPAHRSRGTSAYYTMRWFVPE